MKVLNLKVVVMPGRRFLFGGIFCLAGLIWGVSPVNAVESDIHQPAGIDYRVSFDSVALMQKSAPLRQLYEAEQQSWREYIQRFSAYQVDESFDVTFYYLKVEIAVETPYITGDVACLFTAATDNLTSIKLNLQSALAVDSITGNVAGYSFADDTIRINLDRPYAIGESASINVFYQGVPPIAGGTKGLRYSTHSGGEPIIVSLATPFLAHYWWPCKDGPGDKPDSVYIDITIPDTTIDNHDLLAVSNGILENVSTVGSKKTFQWRERYPIVPYYVMVGIANFAHWQDWFTGNAGESFPIDYYVFDEDSAAARLGVAELPAAMGVFSDLFGPYPFRDEKYGMTQIGFYGAIENQTNTIQNSLSGDWLMTSVHELAHQWYGDMITCRDWHHGWLNEGFATYAEALWREHIAGQAGYQTEIATNAWYTGGTLYLADISDPFNIFLSIIYAKGAYLLHMLRGVLGDEVFFDCLTEYSAHPQLIYDHATTEQFRDICETVSGVDLDYFFAEWVYDEYYPIYRYGYLQDPGNHQVQLYVTQIQQDYGYRPLFTMPIHLRFLLTDGGDTLITVFNDQIDQTFTIDLPGSIDGMLFDPDNWILKNAVEDRPFQLTRLTYAVDDPSGNGDGRPDPGEQNIELVFTYQNTGSDALAVRLEVSTPHPEITFARDDVSFGDLLHGEQGDNAADPIVFSVALEFPPTIVDFTLRFSAYGGSYVFLETLTVDVGPPQVIIIDDDLNDQLNLEQYYAAEFNLRRTPYLIWDKTVRFSPPADTLSGYPLVVWFTGDARSEVLSATDVTNLRDFLDSGGRLLLTGQNIAEDLADDGDSTFLRDYLDTRFIPGSALPLVEGIAGDPISSGQTLPLGGPGGASNQNSPDILQALDRFAHPVYTYYNSTDQAGVRVNNGNYRAVFFGFGCEAIADDLPGYTKRAEVFESVFSWLNQPDYYPGDLDADDQVNPIDVVWLVNYVYRSSAPPPFFNAADVNADCAADAVDVVLLVNYVYLSRGELLPGCLE